MYVFACSIPITGYRVLGWKKILKRKGFWFALAILTFFSAAGTFFALTTSEFPQDDWNARFMGWSILSGLLGGIAYLKVNFKVLGLLSEYEYRKMLEEEGWTDDQIDANIHNMKLEGLIADKEDFD
jgi:hypothetical protein